MFKTVVWASDGSAAAERALPFAKGVAQSSGGRLIVVYVNELRVDSRAALATTIANIEDEELAAVRRQAEALQQDGVAAEFVTGDVAVGGVVRVIADLARDAGADLIVTGTRGRNQPPRRPPGGERRQPPARGRAVSRSRRALDTATDRRLLT